MSLEQISSLPMKKIISSKSILLTGAGGMLGLDLLALLTEENASVTATDRAHADFLSLDITEPDALEKTIGDIKPEWIINCAAYTAVDKAEEEPELAFKINAEGVANLASAASKFGAKVCHISTDYVFGGKQVGGKRGDKPFSEEAQTNPCGVYGKSKFEGEKALREILPENHLVIRTSWLHGPHGPNFLETMLRLGKEKDSLRIVSDQVGSPTYTGWLAEVITRLVASDARGTFHVSSSGDISWFDFAKEIFSQAGVDMKLSTQTTEEAGRPAPRPAYSTFALGKLESFLGAPCPDWRWGISEHLKAMQLKAIEEKNG